jgi:hypothetical protein
MQLNIEDSRAEVLAATWLWQNRRAVVEQLLGSLHAQSVLPVSCAQRLKINGEYVAGLERLAGKLVSFVERELSDPDLSQLLGCCIARIDWAEVFAILVEQYDADAFDKFAPPLAAESGEGGYCDECC